MASIGELIQRYREMDYVDRKNFWITVIGSIIIIYTIVKVTSALGMFKDVASSGADAVVNATADASSGISLGAK